MVDAGYCVGLTIAPIIAASGLEAAYAGLIADVARALNGADCGRSDGRTDHPPQTRAGRRRCLISAPLIALRKRTKFGSVKHVFDAAMMRRLRRFFEAEIAHVLRQARIFYWT